MNGLQFATLAKFSVDTVKPRFISEDVARRAPETCRHHCQAIEHQQTCSG